MNYEIKSKIMSVTDSNMVRGIAIESIELTPVEFADLMPMPTESFPSPSINDIKKLIANEVAERLILDVDKINDCSDPYARTKYKVSSVIFFKPTEKELNRLLNVEREIVNGLNKRLYMYRELVDKPFELIKIGVYTFFKKLTNKYFNVEHYLYRRKK